MIVQTCSCGAAFSGTNANAALAKHREEVHGQEPDALSKKLRGESNKLAYALFLLDSIAKGPETEEASKDLDSKVKAFLADPEKFSTHQTLPAK